MFNVDNRNMLGLFFVVACLALYLSFLFTCFHVYLIEEFYILSTSVQCKFAIRTFPSIAFAKNLIYSFSKH